MIEDFDSKKSLSQIEQVNSIVDGIGRTWSEMLTARRAGDGEALRNLAEKLARDARLIADKLKTQE